ncbi:hypothetical protein JCM10213_006317 [Rhodosporidiobolus nylandii]
MRLPHLPLALLCAVCVAATTPPAVDDALAAAPSGTANSTQHGDDASRTVAAAYVRDSEGSTGAVNASGSVGDVAGLEVLPSSPTSLAVTASSSSSVAVESGTVPAEDVPPSPGVNVSASTAPPPPPYSPTSSSSSPEEAPPATAAPAPSPESSLPSSHAEDTPVVDLPPAPELLSFNEWREKYVVLPDPSVARRAKKAAQRARQDVVGVPVAGAGAATYDGDGADLGSLFAKTDEGQAAEGAGQVVERAEAAFTAVTERVEQRAERASPDAPSTETSSLIQPLPNAGTGEPSDPLLHLKDRSNYAAFECAAMVHRSSRQSKGASSILVEKKDRYMLTPCAAKPKFVDVELCDEIQIDTLVLANFEFFSSTFKHFKASCSVDYPGKAEDWHDLGTFRARNVRGIQVFRPTRKPAFCRYLRLDFLSHFGSEYYCPVSLLRVYGYTQLDAWRESERKAKAIEEALAVAELIEEEAEEQERQLEDMLRVEVESLERLEPATVAQNSTTAAKDPKTGSMATGSEVAQAPLRPSPSSPATALPAIVTPSSSHASDTVTAAYTSALSRAEPSASSASHSSSTSSPLPTSTSVTAPLSIPSVISAPSSATSPGGDASVTPDSSPVRQAAPSRDSAASEASAPSSSSTPPSPISDPPARSVPPASSSPSASEPSSETTVSPTPSPSAHASPSSSPSSSLAPPTPSSASSPATSPHRATPAETPVIATRHIPRNDSHPHPLPRTPVLAPPVHQQPQPGESIYGTIMKRLTSLEHNQTLSMHFIEAQSSMLREAFGRIEKRLGEVEGSRSRQEQNIRQALLDLEKQRVELERERLELATQVGLLTQEVRLEKRLSVAQLIALVLVVIFVGFTRSIPTSPFLHLVGGHTQRQSRSTKQPERRKEEVRIVESEVVREKAELSGTDTPRRAHRHSTSVSLSHRQHNPSKRYPSLSKPGPRRHYGVGVGAAPSSSSAKPVSISRSPRPWTPPARHSSAPPEDPFPTSAAQEAKEAARRRIFPPGSARKSPLPLSSRAYEFPVRATTKRAGLAVDTSSELAGAGASAAPEEGRLLAIPVPHLAGQNGVPNSSTADEADTEPSDAPSAGETEAHLGHYPDEDDFAMPSPLLSRYDADADGEDPEEHGGYHTYSSSDEASFSASFLEPPRAASAVPRGASRSPRPPRPQVKPRPATSMGIPFPSSAAQDKGKGKETSSGKSDPNGTIRVSNGVVSVPEPSSTLPSPPPEPIATLEEHQERESEA